MQRWMSDPELRDILNDPRTSMMIGALQKDNDVFLQIIHDPKIQRLVKEGILQVPPKFHKMFKMAQQQGAAATNNNNNKTRSR